MWCRGMEGVHSKRESGVGGELEEDRKRKEERGVGSGEQVMRR